MILYDKELKLNRAVSDLERNLKIKNRAKDRVKDDYNASWDLDMDFWEDNIAEALTHAAQLLEEKPDDPEARKNACKDLEYFLVAADRLAFEYEDPLSFSYDKKNEKIYPGWDQDAMAIIETLASYNDSAVDKEIYRIVRKFYNMNRLEDSSDSLYYVPDYSELYVKIADYALFKCEDYERAWSYYSLAYLDWYGYEQEGEADDGVIWREQLSALGRIKALTKGMQEDRVYEESERLLLSEKCQEKLVTYINSWEKSKWKVEILRSANEYISAIDMEGRIERLRNEVLIAHWMREQVLYAYLLSEEVSDRAVGMIEKYGNEKRFRPVKAYMHTEKSTTEKILDLVKTINRVDQILECLSVDNYAGKIAYYTSMHTLDYLLPQTAEEDSIGRLSIMHIAYMNDPNEGLILKKVVMPEERQKMGRESANYPYVFLKCFTTRIDDLPMWEMYGDHAQGCCLVIDLARISQRENLQLYNVCYLRKKDARYTLLLTDNPEMNVAQQKIVRGAISALRRFARKGRVDEAYKEAFGDILARLVFLFKNADYAYEMEKRICYNVKPGDEMQIKHTKQNPPKLYVQPQLDIGIEEIILAPKFQNAADRIPYLQERVDELGTRTNKKIKISYSAIEYK